MEVVFSLIADAANISNDGKLNVLGKFDRLNTTGFPTRHPSMTVVIQLRASPFEAGNERTLELILADPDEQPLARAMGRMTVPATAGPEPIDMLVPPITFRDLVFIRPGPHAFVIMLGGEEKGRAQLSVVEHAQELTSDESGSAG